MNTIQFTAHLIVMIIEFTMVSNHVEVEFPAIHTHTHTMMYHRRRSPCTPLGASPESCCHDLTILIIKTIVMYQNSFIFFGIRDLMFFLLFANYWNYQIHYSSGVILRYKIDFPGCSVLRQ